MSYRTRINHIQIFGNNASYQEWFDFLKAHGIECDEDGNYDGEITDFMGMLETLEKIAMNIETSRDKEKAAMQARIGKIPEGQEFRFTSLFDLSDIKSGLAKQAGASSFVEEHLFDALYERIRCGYLFLPVMGYEACRDDLEPCEPPEGTEKPYRLQYYKLKPGRTIRLHAG